MKNRTNDRRKRNRAHDTYEVGYKRPPVSTRFQAGGVGNPRGRPKKQKTVGQMLDQALMTRVKVEENGREKSVTALEIIFRSLVRAAARGDHTATRTLFALYQRHKDSPETTSSARGLEKEDREILEDYFARSQASGSEAAVSSPKPEITESTEREASDQPSTDASKSNQEDT